MAGCDALDGGAQSPAMLLLAATALAAAFPPGTVLLGASTIDGTATDVVAVTPAGEREVVTSIEHARGRLPKGVVAGGALLTVAAVADPTGSVVERTDLVTGARRIVGSGALAGEAPRARGDRGVWVREEREDRFEVVVDGSVAARFAGAWLQPATGDDVTFLAVDANGTNRIVRLAKNALATVASLGKGRFRSPAVAGGRVVVERDLDRSHAEVIDAASGAVLARGLPGLDPRAVDGSDDLVALGSGKKHGAVVVARVGRNVLDDAVTLDAGTAGVATPLATALVGGKPVVVAWLDRGASLPGELVRLDESGARVVAGPEPGAAFEVYGVVGAGSSGSAR